MAGTNIVKFEQKVTGLGAAVNSDPQEQTETVPVERSGDYIIVATAGTTAIQLSDLCPQIALAKMDTLYIKAEVGTIYVILDTAGTATFGSATADMTLVAGDFIYIHLNQTANAGVTIDAAAVTDAFSFILTGTA